MPGMVKPGVVGGPMISAARQSGLNVSKVPLLTVNAIYSISLITIIASSVLQGPLSVDSGI